MRLGEVESEHELLGIDEVVVYTLDRVSAPLVGTVVSTAQQGWVVVTPYGGARNNQTHVERKRVRRLCTMAALIG